MIKAFDKVANLKEIEMCEINSATIRKDLVNCQDTEVVLCKARSTPETMVKNAIVPTELCQEVFLRTFGLCTAAQKEETINRQSQRKKRLRTSTQRNDFYYGESELFKLQYSKRNARRTPAKKAKLHIGSN